MSGLDRALRSVARRLPASVRQTLASTPLGRSVRSRLSAAPKKPSVASAVDSAASAGRPGWSPLLQMGRSLVAHKEHTRAQALVVEVSERADLAGVQELLGAVVASRQGRHRLAADRFSQLERDLAVELAPFELLTSVLTADPERGTDLVRQLVDEGADIPAESWWVAVRHTFPTASDQDNERLVERLDAAYRRDPAAWRPGATKIAWLRRWMGRERNATAPAPAPGAIPFGVVDYGQPDRSWASQNIGDYIQTIAALGHVVRHQNLTFTGEDQELVDLVRWLGERVRPELALDSPAATLDLHLVDRDASTYQAFPEDTWLLAFGWFMHPLFNVDGSFDFPLHPNLRPIFVSFHCNKRGLLTPEAVDYLRANGPIGCRDWTTVDLLLSLDVPAFFSGCLTTTVNTVFPDLEQPGPEEGTVYVDVVRSKVPGGVENVPQRIPDIKKRSFSRNMHDAVDLLEWYRRDFHDVVTMRLHCYLPATSLGMPVRFEPKHNADVRFSGLFRLDAEEFEAIRTPMRDRLQPVLEAIVAGSDVATVRAVWQEVTAADVAAARERHARASGVLERGRALVPEATTPATEADDAIDVVVVPGERELRHVTGVLASGAAASSRPIRAWVLSTREPAAVDGVDVRWVDITGLGGEISPEGAARVSLAELVGADRAIVLPVNGAVTGDLAELATLDLGEQGVAARDTSTVTTSGFATLYRAGERWDAEPDRAFELYRDIHGRHTFDFDAFDTDVMVLDLQRLREREATAVMLGAISQYRLTVRQAWHYLVGADRTVLDPTWSYVPTRDPQQEAAVWVWSDGGKPWDGSKVAGREHWAAFAA